MAERWNVNFNTKRHMFFYEFERLWMILTSLNLIAIFLIIRGSTIPLLSNNTLLQLLFYSQESGDKTLYNIAISYFAAYIFYIIQIYLSEKKKTKRALINIALPVLNLINQTSMFLFVWDNFTKKNTPDDGTILDVDIKKIYYRNSSGYVMAADKDELQKIAQRVQEDYEQIINEATFQFSDNALQLLLIERNIPKEIFQLYKTLLSAEALSKSESATILETYSNDDVNDIRKRLRKLDSLLALKCEFEYAITTDSEDIKKRNNLDKMAFEVILENMEYFSNLPESYRDTLQ